MAGAKLYPIYTALVQTHESQEVLKLSFTTKIDNLTGEPVQPTRADILRNMESIRPGQNVKHIELFKSKWVQVGLD